jgi:AcrR family transcriptional regulator
MKELDQADAERLLDAAFRLVSEPGSGRPSIAELARASNVPVRSILHWYGDLETVTRLAVARRVTALAAPLASYAPESRRLHDALAGYARIGAALFASDDYRRLAYLVVRDGRSRAWLIRMHERDIVGAAQAGLARLVRGAGRLRLDIRASGTRAFVRRLQSELALPMLLPGRKEPTRREIDAVARRAAEEALKSVYPASTIAAALGQLVRRPSPPPLLAATG